MIESNSTQTFLLKHLLIIIGVFVLVFGSVIFFFPQEKVISETEYQLTDALDSLLLCAIGVVLILVNLLYYKMFRNVSLSLTQIIIQDEEGRSYKWTEVETLNRIRFFTPPVYKVKLKLTGEKIFFVSESSQGKYAKIDSPFFSIIIDSSEMGKEIKRTKSKYQI
ncbi:hypothetical protein [Roseivirga sp.]|uniref:hypothetical protein n=1 Tax=Roseivirga sp. TaxID=1964215 RepID=UPI002B26D376|nr:hypothetical protein [Roseivirga sp.]